jgi:hypothetical protein
MAWLQLRCASVASAPRKGETAGRPTGRFGKLVTGFEADGKPVRLPACAVPEMIAGVPVQS